MRPFLLILIAALSAQAQQPYSVVARDMLDNLDGLRQSELNIVQRTQDRQIQSTLLYEAAKTATALRDMWREQVTAPDDQLDSYAIIDSTITRYRWHLVGSVSLLRTALADGEDSEKLPPIAQVSRLHLEKFYEFRQLAEKHVR